MIEKVHPDFLRMRKIMGKITYQTLRERVSEAIRTKIQKHEYHPGDRIVEQELAAEFGVSRGPIREALRELENEGIVHYSRNIGCSVRKVTVKELYELYFMRTSYEVLAVKVIDGKIPEETLKNLKRILENMKALTPEDTEKCIALDNEFHRELVKMAGFATLEKMWSELDYVTILGGYPNEEDLVKVAQKQYPSHKRMVDACQKQDCREICKEISFHYWKTILRCMKEEGLTEKEVGQNWENILV